VVALISAQFPFVHTSKLKRQTDAIDIRGRISGGVKSPAPCMTTTIYTLRAACSKEKGEGIKMNTIYATSQKNWVDQLKNKLQMATNKKVRKVGYLDAQRATTTTARSAGGRRSLQQVLMSRTTTPIAVHMPRKSVTVTYVFSKSSTDFRA
jgi:hypothetical protein